MNIFEYDFEEHMSVLKEEAWEDGCEEGRKAAIRKMYKGGIAKEMIISSMEISREELEEILKEG